MKFSPLAITILVSSCTLSKAFQVQPRPMRYQYVLWEKSTTYNPELGPDDFEMSPEFLSSKSLHNIQQKTEEEASSEPATQDVNLELKPKMLEKTTKSVEINLGIQSDVKISAKTSSKVQTTKSTDNIAQQIISKRYESISFIPGRTAVSPNEDIRLNVSPPFLNKSNKAEVTSDMTTFNFEKSREKAKLTSQSQPSTKESQLDQLSDLKDIDQAKPDELLGINSNSTNLKDESGKEDLVEIELIQSEVPKVTPVPERRKNRYQLDEDVELSAQTYQGAFQFRNINPNMIYSKGQSSSNHKGHVNLRPSEINRKEKEAKSAKIDVGLKHDSVKKASQSRKEELGILSEPKSLENDSLQSSSEGNAKIVEPDNMASTSFINDANLSSLEPSIEKRSSNPVAPSKPSELNYDSTAWSSLDDQRREQQFLDKALGFLDRDEQSNAKKQAVWPNGGNGQPLNQKDQAFIDRALQKNLTNQQVYQDKKFMYPPNNENTPSNSRKEALWPNGGNGQPAQQKDLDFIDRAMGLNRMNDSKKEALFPNGGNGQPLEQKDIDFIEKSMGLGRSSDQQRKKPLWPNGGNGQPLQPKDAEFIDKALGLTGINEQSTQGRQSVWPNGGNSQPLQPEDAKFLDKALSRTKKYREPDRKETDAHLYGRPVTDVCLTPQPIQGADLRPSRFSEGAGMPLRREVQRKPNIPYDYMDEEPPPPNRRTERPIEVNLQLSTQFKSEVRAPELNLSLSPDFKKMPTPEDIRLELSPDRKEDPYNFEQNAMGYEEEMDPEEIRFMQMQRELMQSYMPEGFIEEVERTSQNVNNEILQQNDGSQAFVLSEGHLQKPDFDGSQQYSQRSMEVHSTGGNSYNFEGYNEKFRNIPSDQNSFHQSEGLGVDGNNQNSWTGLPSQSSAYVPEGYQKQPDATSQIQELNLENIPVQSNPYIYEGIMEQPAVSSQYSEVSMESAQNQNNPYVHEGFMEQKVSTPQFMETSRHTDQGQNLSNVYEGFTGQDGGTLNNEKASMTTELHQNYPYVNEGNMEQLDQYGENGKESMYTQPQINSEINEVSKEEESTTIGEQNAARQTVKPSNPYMYEGIIEQVTTNDVVYIEEEEDEIYDEHVYEEIEREHKNSYMYEGYVEDLASSPSSRRVMELSPDRPKVE